ncbi:bifunctional hydroxymethylpyrimidine kinase/phosphomethylpyrimidine kinase [Sphingomonas sp. SUN039]|uniref:bifunctional hydroxymethylpyrimidine kinase/phosphomethylpyrimidine kinase n=1 Tax=Sphingomonas sp. SUN039 TaxID=2937787 RepID=UPI002164EC10|nr:bifunctional hydroxymethylpyrimidine kinase/phosphomethylpyrimidine kinase [Sphingomonas sp. SUN039]UVO52882.1 bifunctional hydroxymethylpyrimidine kinase/phosphomethylpyrimidine kinase [Sphingomonas sp. SUN039]
MTPRILVIAGSDSGGGAGIQADIKTVTMLGGFAMTAITAITAQNTLGVMAVHPVPTDMVIAQIDAVLSDIGADAIKIGMIGSAETANAVADRLAHVDLPIVFDPVMIATSGAKLADAATIMAFRRLMALATVTTPNIPEAEALGGAEAIGRHGCHVVAKGGHADGKWIIDRLLAPDGSEVTRLEAKRFDTDDTHGTGCTFASALAYGLGAGLSIEEAFGHAIRFVRLAILSAPGLGGGAGPLGHQNVTDFRDEDAIPLMSLNQITVGARDYAASVAFYEKLGLRLIVDSPDNGYARFEAPNEATMSLHVEADATPGPTTVYFECVGLDARVAELKRAGFNFDSEPVDQSWLWREASLRDPFGNRIILYKAGENRLYPPGA